MTLTIDLPPDVEGRLAAEARRRGTTPERLALDGLRRLYGPTPDLPADAPDPEALGWPPGYFEATFGSLADDPIERPSQGTMETREPTA